jgi:hypothetical protein
LRFCVQNTLTSANDWLTAPSPLGQVKTFRAGENGYYQWRFKCVYRK